MVWVMEAVTWNTPTTFFTTTSINHIITSLHTHTPHITHGTHTLLAKTKSLSPFFCTEMLYIIEGHSCSVIGCAGLDQESFLLLLSILQQIFVWFQEWSLKFWERQNGILQILSNWFFVFHKNNCFLISINFWRQKVFRIEL